jgi:hypothetical protein
MKSKVTTSYFFEALTTIHYVESQLQKPMGKKAFGKLFSLLETVQKNCSDKEIHAKIHFLYGKIIDQYTTKEMNAIIKLAKNPVKNPNFIQKKIHNLKNFGASQHQLSTLSLIEKSLKKKTPISFSIEPPTPRACTKFPLEEVEKLFDLAKHIYYEEHSYVKLAKEELSSLAKKCLTKHLAMQKVDFLQNKLTTIQALFAAAYELSGKAIFQYPDEKEIDGFFKDLKALMQEEIPGDRNIVPFLHQA